ncbi:uncharacterized protein LOC100127334 isoform X1 [Xenopus laevis]|uniref:E3 ubiquitin-protein ligase n=2 Tax=Xenopus laevis TaxID=8355 RepID=A0A1L8FBI0_XENLA|nr:uncharacterized protein LOC100127334 isoform X1 [Xenopus laevis]XP_018083999.1 uncharacterized protein LOC100127334 isoform X1 [Xenopus laevis]XP_018084001.1 uncharacterized protein LOC100127334 isoform X1 [Xenopus laevis]XP_018084002.1 uncharacterized protein LOC100127334 isoform X1 [Xenopus laevis]XP_041427791.1 uncharacterized protein LOC100127334 isoform X1 [Xenopus laevis]XP_041427792.1 uncharacterized protein LOC100127334 isoform X1 [Xenopus laevis]XP_041427793.1 uncharacterized prot
MPGRGSNNRKPFKTSSMGAAPSQYAEEVDGNQEEMCPICLSRFKKKKTLDKCKHSFCEDCISRALQVKKACPMCGCLYGQLTGNQPDGKMEIFRDPSLHLPGYEKYGTIVIRYTFPAGIQGPNHPNPGVRYPGTTREAFLPDSNKGNKVLKLFDKAFAQRLTFTIGTSVTTGRSNVITWNDIHHRTNITGGPQMFGYPDPTYLQRVEEELEAKGLTAD